MIVVRATACVTVLACFFGCVAASFVGCYASPDVTIAPASQCGDTEAIRKTLFASRCATADCHVGPDPAGSLDLASTGIEARVVNKPSDACGGQTLVVPGDPDKSFFVNKVAADKPTCGKRMPYGEALSAADIQCVKTWVTSLSKSAGGDGGTAGTDSGSQACLPGLTSCAAKCVDTTSDANHCGACGKVCDIACSAGTCVTACPAGTTNCNKSCVDLKTSTNHCGACGAACTGGKVCTAGACSCGATVTLTTLQDAIFTPSCATGQCHLPSVKGVKTIDAQAGLDLRKGNSYANLVNADSSACAGRKRVIPSDVDKSYLYNKLTGVGMCSGSRMPKADQSLTAAELGQVKTWICNGAPNN